MKTALPAKQPIYILSSAPGIEKSIIAAALLQHFDFGVHIPVDGIRQWVISGIAHPIPKWTDETERQFRLARWSALQAATIYAEAGFAVAIDDVVDEKSFQHQYQQLLHGYAIHKVLLTPRADAPNLTEANRALHEELLKSNRPQAGWLVIDSALSVEETVAQILRDK